MSGVAVHAGYKSVEIGDGLVKFAYANAEEIPAGQPVATLTFQTRACVSTEVSSFYEQVNDGKPAAKSSTAAVSYTHLDVYKRQVPERYWRIGANGGSL